MHKKFLLERLRIGFYVFWIAIGIYLAGIAASAGFSASNKADHKTYAKYPATSPEKVQAEFAEINSVIHGPHFHDPALYFKILGKLEDIERSSRRMDYEDSKNATIYRWSVLQSRTSTVGLQNVFDINDVREEFDRQSKLYQKSHPLSSIGEFGDYSKLWLLLLLLYLFFIPMTFAHNCIVLKRNGCSVWYEMTKDEPEFWYYPFIFFIGLFKYPYDVYPARQVARVCRLLLRVASLVVSTAITACAQCGTLIKKAEGKTADDCQTTEDCYRLDISTRSKNQYLGSFVADIFYPGWVQQTSATLSFSGFKNSFTKGLSFNLWNSAASNTKPFGSGYASELDLSVGWSGKISGFNFTAGFTYLDVYPLVVLPRGDVVNASLTVGKAFHVGKNFTVEPYLFNVVAAPVRGKSPNGGWITQSGTNLQWKPKTWLAFTANPHGIHDSGAFGEKEGYLFGGNADIGLKLPKHFTFHPLDIGYGMPIQVKDKRRPHLVFGFGFDYSFGF